jgi:hypothetical protein
MTIGMARPDALIPATDFFLVHYYDKDLLVPGIQTLRYERRTTAEDGRDLWLFREPCCNGEQPKAEDEVNKSDLPLIGFDESQLDQLLDFDGLLAVLNELNAVRPRSTCMAVGLISLEQILSEHGVRERISDFFAPAASHSLHIQLRYTDNGLFLERSSTGVEIRLYTHPLLAPDADARLGGVMKDAGLAPHTDYLADRGRTRIVHYCVPAEPAIVAELCAKILAIGYEMRTDDEVRFSESGA